MVMTVTEHTTPLYTVLRHFYVTKTFCIEMRREIVLQDFEMN